MSIRGIFCACGYKKMLFTGACIFVRVKWAGSLHWYFISVLCLNTRGLWHNLATVGVLMDRVSTLIEWELV